MYNLCKKLKDAGYPQPEGEHAVDYDGYWFNNARKVAEGVDLMKEGTDPVYIPTLSELIKECGDGFRALHFFPYNHEDIRYKACGNGILVGFGKTPEEAVMLLWLELNKK